MAQQSERDILFLKQHYYLAKSLTIEIKTVFLQLFHFAFLHLSCTKNEDLENVTFRVKIIIETCNDAIVQLVENKSNKYTEDDFAFEGQKLDNVFFTSFSCLDKIKCKPSPMI